MKLPLQVRLAVLQSLAAHPSTRMDLVRSGLRRVALALGLLTFVLVVFGHYERAVSVAGRSEVISVRSDGTDFAAWSVSGRRVLARP